MTSFVYCFLRCFYWMKGRTKLIRSLSYLIFWRSYYYFFNHKIFVYVVITKLDLHFISFFYLRGKWSSHCNVFFSFSSMTPYKFFSSLSFALYFLLEYMYRYFTFKLKSLFQTIPCSELDCLKWMNYIVFVVVIIVLVIVDVELKNNY